MNNEMINALVNADSNKRYEYFIKKIADNEVAYGLFNDGWALYESDGNTYFPLWSEKEFAELCIKDEFKSYEVEEIDLEDILNELLYKLKDENIGIAVFPTNNDIGVCVDCNKARNDIEDELAKY